MVHHDATKLEDVIIVHYYPNKEKLMIQAAEGDEKMLLVVLELCPDIQNSFKDAHAEDPSPPSSAAPAVPAALVLSYSIKICLMSIILGNFVISCIINHLHDMEHIFIS